MDDSSDTSRGGRIDTVMALARQRVPTDQHAAFEVFAQAWFAHLDLDDLAARAAEDLLGALLSLWHLAEQRAPGETKIRILSPTLADSGWASRHSVIEIINDDMPFLVDTTTMELNRQGLTLHLVVHPIVVVQRDEQGKLQALRPRLPGTGQDRATRESWMHVEVDRLVDPPQRAELLAGLKHVLADVRVAVRDWQAMLARLHEAIDELDHIGAGGAGASWSPRAAPSCNGWPTITSRCWATGATTWSPKGARTCCAWSPAAGWACSARVARASCRSASRPCRRRCARWHAHRCRWCW